MADITKDQVIEWLSGLSVLDIAALVKELEDKWGVSAAAPVAVVAGGAAAAPAEEKDAFDVILKSVDASKKISVIKEVRAITSLGLAEAKALVEGAPKAIKEGVAKFGGKIPNKAALKLPLRDGDTERDDEAYKNSFFVNANSTTAPQIVDRSVQPILDRSEVYSGCYARVSVNFYAFNSNGNRGIACGLGNIQKVRDGEPLGGKASAESDFATDDEEDFLG